MKNLEFTYKDGSTVTFNNIRNFFNTGDKLIVEHGTTTVTEIHYKEVQSYRYV